MLSLPECRGDSVWCRFRQALECCQRLRVEVPAGSGQARLEVWTTGSPHPSLQAKPFARAACLTASPPFLVFLYLVGIWGDGKPRGGQGRRGDIASHVTERTWSPRTGGGGRRDQPQIV